MRLISHGVRSKKNKYLFKTLGFNPKKSYIYYYFNTNPKNENRKPQTANVKWLISLSVALVFLLQLGACAPDEPAPKIVTFNSNGGNAIEAQKVKSGGKATKPTNPVHSTILDKEFIGWYSDEAKTQAFDFDTPITANITFYAKWLRYSKVPKAGGGFYDKTECVRDDETGLMWEGKTDDGGLRDKDNKYTNYSIVANAYSTPKYPINYSEGDINASTNSIGYVNAVNAMALGGFTDWRMPTKDELLTLNIDQQSDPKIDANWFPNIMNNSPLAYYWSSQYDGLLWGEVMGIVVTSRNVSDNRDIMSPVIRTNYYVCLVRKAN